MKPCEAIGFAMLKGIIHSKWRFQSFSSYHIVQRASVDVLFFKNGKNSNPIETLEACDIKGFLKFFLSLPSSCTVSSKCPADSEVRFDWKQQRQPPSQELELVHADLMFGESFWKCVRAPA